ncbi:DNA-binding protein [Micromonospora endolithica]|uniref:DNA-binding protein n=1 Tax=Micromonospora endolithica TaxID=230091 RepID=A0A3A9YVB6_9ACTN|nr:DNA-binding protein [Micromonospora endolithica]
MRHRHVRARSVEPHRDRTRRAPTGTTVVTMRGGRSPYVGAFVVSGLLSAGEGQALSNWHSSKAVADRLGISIRSVRRLVDRGELRKAKIGGLVKIHEEDVAAFEARIRQS